MNCQQAQNGLLLRDTREGSRRQEKTLEAHLRTCPECRAFEQDLRQIQHAERKRDAQLDAPEATVESILREAARALPAVRKQRSASAGAWRGFFEIWRPALIYATAAILLLLLGVQALRTPSTERAEVSPAPMNAVAGELPPGLAWDPGLDDEVETLSLQLAFAYYDAGGESTGNGNGSLEELAAELLELEGWNI